MNGVGLGVSARYFFIFIYFSAYIKHTGGVYHKSIQTPLGSSPQKMTNKWSQMDAQHNCDSIFWNHDHARQKIAD